MKSHRTIPALMFCLVLLGAASFAGAAEVVQSRGQVVYVPVYSHIYIGNNERPYYLAATLSIRNTSFKDVLVLTSVEYLDSDGNLLKNYVEKPVTVKAMGSIRFVVKEADTAGGSGAKFIVRWNSGNPVSYPLIESVMISTTHSQGISFTSRGQVVEELK